MGSTTPSRQVLVMKTLRPLALAALAVNTFFKDHSESATHENPKHQKNNRHISDGLIPALESGSPTRSPSTTKPAVF
jgi:hypothetical protein